MLQILDKNTSTDIITANKNIFIPSCYSSDFTESKYHKNKLNKLHHMTASTNLHKLNRRSFGMTKLTLFGCLAKTGDDHYLKLSSQYHILSYKVFFDKKHTLRQIFCGPLRLAFFFLIPPPFQNVGLKVASPAEKRQLILRKAEIDVKWLTSKQIQRTAFPLKKLVALSSF